MMMKEFIDRTGFEPTAAEYEAIEEQYYIFNGNKDDFCKTWVKDGGIRRLTRRRAEKIAELEKQIEKERNAYCEKQVEIEKLREELDRELEWRPIEGVGTGMKQEQYEDLASQRDVEQLSDESAKAIIYREFGFSMENITIVKQVSSYEVNKYHRLRVSETWERTPVYDATDWNYIRFNCRGWKWEMVNGELREYNE